MARSDGWRPRLGVDLTPEQYFKLQNLFPWGVQQAFWRAVVDDVISIVEAMVEIAIAAVLSNALRHRDVIKSLKVMEGADKGHEGTSD